jgi:hypothetical protein
LNVNLCKNIFEVLGKFNKLMKMELTKRIEKVEKWVDLEMLNFGKVDNGIWLSCLIPFSFNAQFPLFIHCLIFTREIN